MSITHNIAKNIQSMRQRRQLTQDGLSQLAKIPRSTITNIESGEGNPTVSALEKIAQGLQVAVSELLLKPKASQQLIKAHDVPRIEKSGSGATQFKLLPDKIHGMEIDRIELMPGVRMRGVPHVAHTKEYLTCVKGCIEVATDGEKFSLKVGDVLAFPGDLPHSYFNASNRLAVGLSVVALAFQ